MTKALVSKVCRQGSTGIDRANIKPHHNIVQRNHYFAATIHDSLPERWQGQLLLTLHQLQRDSLQDKMDAVYDGVVVC